MKYSQNMLEAIVAEVVVQLFFLIAFNSLFGLTNVLFAISFGIGYTVYVIVFEKTHYFCKAYLLFILLMFFIMSFLSWVIITLINVQLGGW